MKQWYECRSLIELFHQQHEQPEDGLPLPGELAFISDPLFLCRYHTDLEFRQLAMTSFLPALAEQLDLFNMTRQAEFFREAKDVERKEESK
jgi:hypothetical protein